MTSRIDVLCERLRRDDDEGIYGLLLEHFEAEAADRPFLHRWRAGLGLDTEAMSKAALRSVRRTRTGFQPGSGAP